MRYLIITGLVLGILCSCNNNRTSNDNWNDSTPTDIESQENRNDYTSNNRTDSLGYYGVFEGMLPAENSRTVKAKMTLYDNNRYIIHSADIDDNTQTAEEQGTYLIFGDLLTLTPDNNGTRHYYQTGNDHIIRVDENKKVIPGIHSQNFKLNRTQD